MCVHEGILFLSRFGERIDDSHLTHLMRRYIAASGVNKAGAMHIFRHSMATLMLEGGADVRIIQQILGHVELSTTEIYTRVSTVAVFPAEPALLFQEPDKALDGFDTAPLVGDADAGIGCEWCLALVARK